MSLEAYTGKISDLVDTNPTGSDPRSQGDDHLRGIKYTLKQSFPKATGPLLVGPGVSVELKSGNPTIGTDAEDALQIDSVAKAISAVAPYLLKGDIAAQSLTPQGYVKLASGLIIQWGSATSVSGGNAAASYSIPFTSSVRSLAIPANVEKTGVCNVSNGLSDVTFRVFDLLGNGPAGISVLFIAVGY